MVCGLVIDADMLYGLSSCGVWVSDRCRHVVWTEFMWLVD